MSSKTRVQLDLQTEDAKALDALRDHFGLRSRADAVRMALAVLEWVQQESGTGRRVLAVDGNSVSCLVVPGLTNSIEAETNE